MTTDTFRIVLICKPDQVESLKVVADLQGYGAQSREVEDGTSHVIIYWDSPGPELDGYRQSLESALQTSGIEFVRI